MQDKKILLITLRGDFGGGPRHVDSIYQNLKDEFDLFIASPVEEPYGIKWKNQLIESNNFLELPHRKFRVRNFLSLISFVKRNKIRVIHAHGRGAGIYARLLKPFLPQTKILYTLHGFHSESFSPLKKQISILIERILSLFTTVFINISENERLSCIKHKIYKKEKSIIIYNGIPDTFNKNYNIESLREKLGLPSEKFIIVCITRFDLLKNLIAFVEIARLIQSDDDIFFVLSGDGKEMEKVKSTINKYNLKNIQLTGFINNPLDYIISSDAYLTTSIVEGLPYSLIEANMCGKPVIASNVRGNNEVILNEVNGLLFELSDLSEAVNKIKRIKNDESFYQLLSNNARKRYIEYFTEEKMIKELKELYKRFLK
jgi:glycosyltransferase involved in cell wall biosynthesis